MEATVPCLMIQSFRRRLKKWLKEPEKRRIDKEAIDGKTFVIFRINFEITTPNGEMERWERKEERWQ